MSHWIRKARSDWEEVRRIEFPSSDKSQPAFAESSVYDRLAFTWRSLRNRTGKETFREKGIKAGSPAGRDILSSSVQQKNLQNYADLSRFSGKYNEVSLRPRLRGRAGGIRTLGTGLNDARADVCVSYREPIFNPETEGRLVSRHSGQLVRFPIQWKGE